MAPTLPSAKPMPSTKRWASIRVFCAILTMIFFVKWGSGSYLIAMLTTLERAFGLSATELAGLKSIGKREREWGLRIISDCHADNFGKGVWSVGDGTRWPEIYR